MDRRSFIVKTTGAISLVVLQLNMSAQTTAPSRDQRVEVGAASDFAAGTVTDRFADPERILIAHKDGRIYAMTAICTHRKGIIGVTDGRLVCTSHGSVFDIAGRRVSGPANGALVRYAISLNAQGTLVVDKSRTFDESKWNEAASFYATAAQKG